MVLLGRDRFPGFDPYKLREEDRTNFSSCCDVATLHPSFLAFEVVINFLSHFLQVFCIFEWVQGSYGMKHYRKMTVMTMSRVSFFPFSDFF